MMPMPLFAVFGFDDAILIGALVATVASAATSAYASYASGQAQKKAANTQQKIADNNAMAQRQQASYDSQRIRERNQRLRGAQVAAISKSGQTLGGSAADVIDDSDIQGELEAMNTLYKGDVTAGESVAEGHLAKMRGDSAAFQGTLAAGGSILSGTGQGLSIYSSSPQFKKKYS